MTPQARAAQPPQMWAAEAAAAEVATRQRPAAWPAAGAAAEEAVVVAEAWCTAGLGDDGASGERIGKKYARARSVALSGGRACALCVNANGAWQSRRTAMSDYASEIISGRASGAAHERRMAAERRAAWERLAWRALCRFGRFDYGILRC